MNLCCVVKLWWSQFHKFWKLWNCASQFVMFVKLWFAHFEFWKPLKNLSFAMNGFEESYYTIPKSNISRLKIYNCYLRSKFFQNFSKKFQNWPNSRYENSTFHRFHNFSQFVKLWRSLKLDCVVLWLWCLLKKSNCVVLWNCEFSQSQLHNFTNPQFRLTTLNLVEIHPICNRYEPMRSNQ